MPTKLNNVNFFIFQRSLPLRLAAMVRSRDFAVSRKSCHSLPLSSENPRDVADRGYNKRENLRGTALTLFSRSRREFENERREHQDQCAHYQHPGQDGLPPSCARRRRTIDLWVRAASKNQAETVGMIIRDQNALYCFALRICGRQAARLLDDKNPPRTDTGLLACGRKAKRVGIMMIHGPNEACREWHRPIAKAFPFHSSRYGGPAHRRYGASGGFFGLTREAITTTSLGRALFAK